MKRVRIIFDGEEEDTTIHCHCRNHSDVYTSDILDMSSEYNHPFSKLKMRARRSRIEYVAKTVLSCCVDIECMADDSIGYLKHNKDLAMAVIDFIDGVKENIENHMHVKFSHLQNEAVTSVADDKDDVSKVAITILCDATMKGYSRISGDIAKYTSMKLPSYYMLTKNRPKLEDIVLTPLPPLDNNLDDENEANDVDIDLINTSNGRNTIVGGKMYGTYQHHLELLVQKHTKYNREINL